VPPREWRVRVSDIIEAAERALRYTEALTFEEFAAELRSVDAVSYAIVIMGEAAGHIPDMVTRAAPEVPWAEIRGMRNKVAHEYFGVEMKILWQTVREDLPALLPLLRAVAARRDLP
jgi:uncharacterized protein with HEPN domain